MPNDELSKRRRERHNEKAVELIQAAKASRLEYEGYGWRVVLDDPDDFAEWGDAEEVRRAMRTAARRMGNKIASYVGRNPETGVMRVVVVDARTPPDQVRELQNRHMAKAMDEVMRGTLPARQSEPEV